VAYYTVTLGSAAEALRALKTAGVSGAMAIAASPTGVGTVALSAAAVSELAESAAMAGVSFMSYNMAERSEGIMKESVAKLKETVGYKIRSVGDDILDQMEAAGGHTLEKHVSITDEELIKRAIQEDVEAATSFTNKSTAVKAVKQNLRKNADDIVDWLANPQSSRKTFDVTHNYGIGKGVLSDNKTILSDLTKSRIVLVKDSTQELGFRIISAFPVVK